MACTLFHAVGVDVTAHPTARIHVGGHARATHRLVPLSIQTYKNKQLNM